MNNLYIVRHAENLANLTFEFSNRKVDYSLTLKGVLQAQQTAQFFQDKNLHAIYSSPLKRTVETAQIIAQPADLPVIVMEAFREIDVGDFEGQPPTREIWAQHNALVKSWHNGHPEQGFPNGENYHMVLARALAGFKQVLYGREHENLLVVGHGGLFFHTLRALDEGIDPTILAGGLPNCSITHLEARLVAGQIEAHLLSFASIAHLSGEAAELTQGSPKEEEHDSSSSQGTTTKS